VKSSDSPSFESLFGRSPDVHADAPGRVNLIGEHTDYNGGFVLPIAIPQRTRAALATARDGRVRAWSSEAGGVPVEYHIGAEARTGTWIDYVQGVTRALSQAGRHVGGFDLRLESDVPVGSGLSSSAALEISVLRGLRELFRLDLDDVGMAVIGRQAENDFVGAPVGIMDQMAAALADEHTALFLDARSLEWQRVALPAAAALTVVDSGIKHAHAGGEYRTRRAECQRACELLAIAELRELSASDLAAALPQLPAPLDRRVRHVVTENARVEEAREAMRAGDPRRIGELMVASHASMRDDYEISTPEIDQLVADALVQRGVHGARLTGGGFGGCIVVLARADGAAEAGDRIVAGARARGVAASRVVPG
jgi:galactokinase